MQKWTFKNSVFKDNESNDKLMIVIEDIITEMDRLIPAGPPVGFKTIVLMNDKVLGPTFYWPLGHEFYKIVLNISDVNYNQIAFQFSQELCRIYCDPGVNTWLIQLFSHVFALYSLDYLGKNWKKHPPTDELKNYWYNFDTYKSNLLNAAFSKVDIVKYQVANEWVQYQINKLKQKDKINRGKLLIIAYELLPMFKEYPEGWRMLPYIGMSSQPVLSETSVTGIKEEPDFQKIMESLPENLHAFAQKFYSKIGVTQYS